MDVVKVMSLLIKAGSGHGFSFGQKWRYGALRHVYAKSSLKWKKFRVELIKVTHLCPILLGVGLFSGLGCNIREGLGHFETFVVTLTLTVLFELKYTTTSMDGCMLL